MPRIQSFDSCQIGIHPKDPMPPHFHVLASDGREWLVRIDNAEVLEGSQREKRESPVGASLLATSVYREQARSYVHEIQRD